MYISDGTYAYFLIIDAKAHFLGTRKMGEVGPDTDEKIYKDALNESFIYHPNWEAVGASVLLENREDRNTARAYVSGEILYDYKQKMKPQVIDLVHQIYPSTSFEWNELPGAAFDQLNNHMTFVRDTKGSWTRGEVPVERAIFASNKQSRKLPLGRPGGPCQVIHNIDEANLPDEIKEDMKEDIHRGKDLDNADASQIYDYETVRLSGDLIPSVRLSNHAQYRMDFRSVTVDSLKSAFYEFEKWFKHKQRNKRDVSLDDMDKLERLVSGKSVRFEARKLGLTIIFAVNNDKSANLISAWWQGKPNPKAPKPGECRIGSDTDENLEAIVSDLQKASSTLPLVQACGGKDGGCGCGGSCDCGGSCGCGGSSPEPKEDSSWYDEPEDDWYDDDDDDWYEASKWDDAYLDRDKWDEEPKEYEDEEDGFLEYDDDDDTVDSYDRIRNRSDATEYQEYRRNERQRPAERKMENREVNREREKPSVQMERARYRRMTKNRPKSPRRSPKPFSN